METAYNINISKESGAKEARAVEVASLLTRLKVLSYSFGKIHVDEVLCRKM